MRYLGAFLFSLLGGAMCVFAEWLRWTDKTGLNGIQAPSWDLYGSVFLVVGLAGFAFFGALDIWVTKATVNQVKRRF